MQPPMYNSYFYNNDNYNPYKQYTGYTTLAYLSKIQNAQKKTMQKYPTSQETFTARNWQATLPKKQTEATGNNAIRDNQYLRNYSKQRGYLQGGFKTPSLQSVYRMPAFRAASTNEVSLGKNKIGNQYLQFYRWRSPSKQSGIVAGVSRATNIAKAFAGDSVFGNRYLQSPPKQHVGSRSRVDRNTGNAATASNPASNILSQMKSLQSDVAGFRDAITGMAEAMIINKDGSYTIEEKLQEKKKSSPKNKKYSTTKESPNQKIERHIKQKRHKFEKSMVNFFTDFMCGKDCR